MQKFLSCFNFFEFFECETDKEYNKSGNNQCQSIFIQVSPCEKSPSAPKRCLNKCGKQRQMNKIKIFLFLDCFDKQNNAEAKENCINNSRNQIEWMSQYIICSILPFFGRERKSPAVYRIDFIFRVTFM